MTHKEQSTKKENGKGGGAMLFTVALGAALAAAAGYYSTHKEEVDKEAKKRMDQLAKMYKEARPKVEKRVMEVWGEVSDEAIATYLDVRGSVLDALEEENLERTGKVIKKQYDRIVESAIKEARKSGILSKDIEKNLEKLFKMDWEDVKKVFEGGIESATKIVEKEARNVMKEGKKLVKKHTKRVGCKKKKVVKKRKPASPKSATKKRTTSAQKTTKKPATKRKAAKKK